jgi:hypothetical protein
MNKSQDKISKRTISKWLINITLIFSLFTFGGTVSEHQLQHRKATHTEQKNLNANNGKRAISLSRFLSDSRVIAFHLKHTGYHVALLSQYYQALLRTKLHSQAEWLKTFKKPDKVSKTKYTARSGDHPITSISRG